MKWAGLLALLLCGCAETDFYDRNGNMIARFQGDMTGQVFHYGADGSIDWNAATISHSDATRAWGTAASQVVGAAGVAAVGALAHVP